MPLAKLACAAARFTPLSATQESRAAGESGADAPCITLKRALTAMHAGDGVESSVSFGSCTTAGEAAGDYSCEFFIESSAAVLLGHGGLSDGARVCSVMFSAARWGVLGGDGVL